MVYVDELRDYTEAEHLPPRLRRWWCHMTADTLDELHALAARIGMKRAWFQDKASFPHYDLQPSMRARAVRHGAVEVRCEDRVRQMRAERKALQEKTHGTGESEPG